MSGVPQARINLIGMPGAGKSPFTREFAAQGFATFSPSDRIRQFAAQEGIVLNGRSTYRKAHELMLAQDPTAMTGPLIAANEPLLCIDGLRVPNHNYVLQSAMGLVGIALACPDEVRYQRIRAGRAERRARDIGTLFTDEELHAEEIDEYANSDPSKPSIKTVMDMAECTVETDQPWPLSWAQTAAFMRDRFDLKLLEVPFTTVS